MIVVTGNWSALFSAAMPRICIGDAAGPTYTRTVGRYTLRSPRANTPTTTAPAGAVNLWNTSYVVPLSCTFWDVDAGNEPAP